MAWTTAEESLATWGTRGPEPQTAGPIELPEGAEGAQMRGRDTESALSLTGCLRKLSWCSTIRCSFHFLLNTKKISSQLTFSQKQIPEDSPLFLPEYTAMTLLKRWILSFEIGCKMDPKAGNKFIFANKWKMHNCVWKLLGDVTSVCCRWPWSDRGHGASGDVTERE